ncbi:1-deoxy-D-xylulose-5-phosphate synthase [Defluviitalea saccharophila]|uniref:1-deoxy-D-xylulose-5-phosphate synthase n=1 Tax=Defluviitalea saccharophila TaxID=879970 RepID=A0ABZ2Y536_9FIRM|nr:1-deoxy-D-xylulose-5-phosphate synthase [Candidatus Epulonipiscium sp.]
MLKQFIDSIDSPEKLKKISIDQLNIVAREIRHFLINTLSRTGGHLASNLGVVELTLALHYCFNSPQDKIIWDVGHQSYVHKIITGRKDKFCTLKQMGGISGFPKRKESVHDIFETGHSSTSISAALGMAAGRDLTKEDYSVIAVIGDGSLTGGMAFEALNNAGRSNTNLIVVLNDNQMSISPNVGGLSKYLNSIRTEPVYLEVKEDIDQILKKIPGIGKSVARTVKKTKESIRYLLVPGTLFEELGFTYVGPINGHDIKSLVSVLKKVKRMKGPILLHVKTVKGKGYPHAEKLPCQYHGIGPFDVKTGQALSESGEATYSDVFGNTIVNLANENNKIVAITAAMPDGTGLNNFQQKFPERFFDVGIAEQHAVTFAAGLASSGFHPVFAVYSSFLQRAYDQIIHDVCIQNLPMVFAIDRAGIVGQDGETHQGIFDLSFLSHMPNMTIMAPCDQLELEEMLKFAFTMKGPVAIRYPKGKVFNLMKSDRTPIEYKKSEVVCEGKDGAILAVGKMMEFAQSIVENLKQEGIELSLINPRFIKPIDEEMILEVCNKHKFIFTMEDNVITGGFGSKVLQILAEHNIKDVSVKIFAFPDQFIEHGTSSELYKKYHLDAENMQKTIKKTIIEG